MPLFSMSKQHLTSVEQTNFLDEKTLQTLIEANLEAVFNCRLIKSEFATGPEHAGRIDTLALSEDNNPVIIEYKKVKYSELINQSLFYLHWMHDHRGDFEIAAQKALGPKVEVDWSDVRVICIAPNYKKYDLHAARVIGTNLELWTYRLFKNDSIYLEEVLEIDPGFGGWLAERQEPEDGGRRQEGRSHTPAGVYSLDDHFNGKPDKIVRLAQTVREFIMGLDPAIEESPKKMYIAYKISQNIACMELRKHNVLLYLKLNPQKTKAVPEFARRFANWPLRNRRLRTVNAQSRGI